MVDSVSRQMGKRCSGKGTRAEVWETLLRGMQRRGTKDCYRRAGEWHPLLQVQSISSAFLNQKVTSGERRRLKIECNARNRRLECSKRKVRK